MEDILLLQLLKKKGIISDSDLYEFHELADIDLQNMQIYPASEDTYTSESTHIEETLNVYGNSNLNADIIIKSDEWENNMITISGSVSDKKSS